MKHGILAVLILLFSTGLFGQSALPTPLPDSAQAVISLMRNPDTSYWDVIQFADTYHETTSDSLSESYLKKYGRWRYFWNHRVDIAGDRKRIVNELQTISSTMPICTGNGSWVQENSAISDEQVSGIITAVYAPPGQSYSQNSPPQKILIGSNTAGIWKTIDGGNSWTCTTDALRMPGLGINSIVGDPNDPDIVYFASGITGAFQDPKYGMGLWKSEDGGDTWQSTSLSFDAGPAVANDNLAYKVILTPAPTGGDAHIYVLTGNRIHLSTNGGASSIFFDFDSNGLISENEDLFDIEIIPGNTSTIPTEIYLTTQTVRGVDVDQKVSKVFRYYSNTSFSTPGSWVNITPSLTNTLPTPPASIASDGFLLATTDSDLGVIYTAFAHYYLDSIGDATADNSVYKSSDQGTTWNVVAADVGLPNVGFCDDAWLTPLRPEFEINSVDNNIFYYGINCLAKSYDGGLTAGFITDYNQDVPSPNPLAETNIHADIRDFQIYHSSQGGLIDALLVGTDGGLSYSADGGLTWINLEQPMILTQYFDIANTSQSEDFYAGGAQDNGTQVKVNGNWNFSLGGDGGEIVVDRLAPQSTIFARNNTWISVSTDGGESFTITNGSINMLSGWPIFDDMNGGSSQEFTPYPYRQSEFDARILFCSRKDVFTRFPPNHPQVFSTSPITLPPLPIYDFGGNFPNKFNRTTTFEVAPSDGNTIYLSTDRGNGGYIFKSTDGGDSWDDIHCPPLGNNIVAAITIDPRDPDKVYLGPGGFDQKVLYSNDGGITWIEFPALPVTIPINDLEYHKGSQGIIYAATDVGVYRYFPSTNSWECFNNDLPVCIVTDLEFDYCRDMLVIGTFGRGIWETPLNSDFASEEISQNTVWTVNQAHNIGTDLVIKEGKYLLLQGTINMGNGKKIIVEPGARLIVDGGIITNQCGGTWAGIEVWGDKSLSQAPTGFPFEQGSVDLVNGAIIEHARNAISMGEHQPYKTVPSGGVITANGAIFRNNRRSVEFLKYGFQNASAFNNVTFTVDTDFRFTDDFPAHVTLWDVKGVKFQNCTFENNLNSKAWDAEYSNGIFSIDAGYEVAGGCSFEGFNRGVRASGAATMNNIVIQHSDFSNNAWGNLITEFDNPVISDNDFYVGTDYLITQDDEYEGLVLDRTDGFLIEDNYFTKTANITLVEEIRGIRVSNSLGSENEIYKNSFYNLEFGVMSEGINREINVTNGSGLQFICNDFLEISKHDIESQEQVGASGQANSGMRDIQGSFSPVSFPHNDFYHGTNFSENDVKNSASNIVTYVHDGFGPFVPTSYTSGKVIPTNPYVYTPLPPCGDYVIGADIVPLSVSLRTQIMADFESADSAHANILYNLNQLIDGGNTTQMLNQIQQGWTQGAWDLRNDLMSQSPYVSSEVLMEVAEGDELPHAMLLEVCLANPDATREGEFIDFVETGISNPMPSYMIDMIVASWGEITARTLLQSGLGYYGRERSVAANILLADLKSDSLDHTSDIRYWLNRRGEMSDHYALVESYISTNQFDSALIVLNAVPDSFNIADIPFLSQAQADFQTYLKFREDLVDDNRSIMELDSLEILDLQNLAYVSNNRVAGLADNILCFGYGICKDRSASDSTGSTSRRANPFMDPQEFIKTQYYQIKVFPNPASEYATFEWDLVDLESQTTLTILDASGRIVTQIPIGAMQGQWLWDTRTVSAGLYLYELRTQDELLSQGKLAVE